MKFQSIIIGLSILIVGLAQHACAQTKEDKDLHIQYDWTDFDNPKYRYGTTDTWKPLEGRVMSNYRNKVRVKVININPELYRLGGELETSDLEIEGADVEPFLEQWEAFAESISSSGDASPDAELIDSDDLLEAARKFGNKSMSIEFLQLESAMNKVSPNATLHEPNRKTKSAQQISAELSDEMQVLHAAIQQHIDAMNSAYDTAQANVAVLNQLKLLKSGLERFALQDVVSTIKQNSSEAISSVLGGTESIAINIQNLAAEHTSKLGLNVASIESNFAEADKKVKAYLGLLEALRAIVKKADDGADVLKKIENQNTELTGAWSVAKEHKSKLEEGVAKISTFKWYDHSMDVQEMYQAIQAQKFELNMTAAIADKDVVTAELSIEKSSEKDGNTIWTTKRTEPLSYGVKGGGKFSGSSGLGFTHFINNQYDFFTKDDKIAQQSGNAFTPSWMNMVHYHRRNGYRSTYGLTFGLGIPLVGDDKDVQYMLGVSWLGVAANQRINLTAGIVGAEVNKLADGYKIGDKLEAGAEIPTTRALGLGGMFTISYNISKGNAD